MIPVEALLSGPRGRRLLLEIALASEGDLELDDLPASLRLAVADASRGLDPNPGVMLVAGGSWWQRRRARRTPYRPSLFPDDVAQRLRGLPLAEPTPQLLHAALVQAVDTARYWQEPDGDDALTVIAPVRHELHRVAEQVSRSPRTRWWSTGLDHDAQRSVSWDDDDDDADETASQPVGSARPVPVAEQLRTWRADVVARETRAVREQRRRPRARWSGEWWSTPPRELVRTTRALPDGSPAGLWFVEDSLGPERGTVRRVDVPARVHVYEIEDAASWAALCHRFPVEVTAQKRHDWHRTTGRDGRWVMPDWSRVAEHHAGVHLTAAAYLGAAGTAIAVADGTASVIAGWDLDETYWLTDDVRPEPEPETWVLDASSRVPSWSRSAP